MIISTLPPKPPKRGSVSARSFQMLLPNDTLAHALRRACVPGPAGLYI